MPDCDCTKGEYDEVSGAHLLHPMALDCVVNCDQSCGALVTPQTLEEALAAVEHWRSHSYMSGCSHGC